MRLNRTRESEIAEILAANLGNPSRLPDTTANPSGLFAMSCCGGPVIVPVRIFITDFAFFFAAITADAARCCSANDNLIKCLVRRCFTQWNMERVKPEAKFLFFDVRAARERTVISDSDDHLARVVRVLVAIQIIDKQHKPAALRNWRSSPSAMCFHSSIVCVQTCTHAQHRIHIASIVNTAGGSPDHE